MQVASIFKEFVITYNRTYETKEGEDPAWAVPVLIRSGPSPYLAPWCWGGEGQKRQCILSRMP